jgi:hypothetical protein
VAGGAEAGDRRGVVCAWFVGLNCCPAVRRECEPGIQLAEAVSRRAECTGRPVGIPVVVTADQAVVAPQPSSVVETIEIDLGGKYRVRVSSGVDALALRRVLDVLERR